MINFKLISSSGLSRCTKWPKIMIFEKKRGNRYVRASTRSKHHTCVLLQYDITTGSSRTAKIVEKREREKEKYSWIAMNMILHVYWTEYLQKVRFWSLSTMTMKPEYQKSEMTKNDSLSLKFLSRELRRSPKLMSNVKPVM